MIRNLGGFYDDGGDSIQGGGKKHDDRFSESATLLS